MQTVRVTGMKGVMKTLRNLNPKMREEVKQKGIYSLAQNLQRRMKRRAPKSTGWLRRSIMVEKTDKGAKVVVHAFYGMAVEEGRNKNFTIPRAYFEQHQRMPDAPGRRVTRKGGSPMRWVTLSGRAQPFVAPSINSITPQIPKLLNKYVKRAIKASK